MRLAVGAVKVGGAEALRHAGRVVRARAAVLAGTAQRRRSRPLDDGVARHLAAAATAAAVGRLRSFRTGAAEAAWDEQAEVGARTVLAGIRQRFVVPVFAENCFTSNKSNR